MVTGSSQECRRFMARVVPTITRISGAVLLCVFAGGCEQSVAPVTSIVLRNETQDSIGYEAVELSLSPLFDPVTFAIADSNFRGRTVAPGSELVVKPTTIAGYFPGAGVQFALFRIRAGRALISGMPKYTNAELRSTNGVIAISASTLVGKVANQLVSQGAVDLFTPLDSTALIGTRVRTAYSRVRKRDWVRGIHIVKLSGDAKTLLAAGPAVTISVGSGKQLMFRGDRVTSRASSMFSWHGILEGGPSGSADLVATANGLVGTVRVDTTAFYIEPLGDGLMAVSDIDVRRVPVVDDQVGPTILPDTSVVASVKSSGERSATRTLRANPSATSVNNGAPYIKVLVVYTAAAAAASSDIVGAVQAAVDEANTVYSNSGIQQTLLVAGISQIAYNEAGKHPSIIVDELRGTTDSYLNDVHPLRTAHKADVVVLIYNNDVSLCGFSSGIGSTQATAFSVVRVDCLSSTNLAFPHEIGHLEGARHDILADPVNTPRADAHGYIPPTKTWHTVMADASSCSFCPVVPYFSTPNRTYPPTGQVLGNISQSNNSAVVHAAAPQVQLFFRLDAPAYFSQQNYSTGQSPRFGWPSVTGASQYNVYRCETGSSYCGTVSFSFFNYGATWAVQDVLRTIAPSIPCTKQGIYTVRASGEDGESVSAYPPISVCLQ
jgi:peptidyl-Asp metalloendopeptidase